MRSCKQLPYVRCLILQQGNMEVGVSFASVRACVCIKPCVLTKTEQHEPLAKDRALKQVLALRLPCSGSANKFGAASGFEINENGLTCPKEISVEG